MMPLETMCYVSHVMCQVQHVPFQPFPNCKSYGPAKCHVSCITCQVSLVTCQLSHVTCHMSGVTSHKFYFSFFFSFRKWWSQLVEGFFINRAYPVYFLDFFLLKRSETQNLLFSACSPLCKFSKVRPWNQYIVFLHTVGWFWVLFDRPLSQLNLEIIFFKNIH